jgi:filamentous hemagglutinin
MLSALQIDPATAQKRLGDGFYEQKLIREQVLALTGNRYLGDYQSDEQQYMALMNSGLTYAKQLNLRPGIALSADQVAQLTSDMVWLVSQDVTLADGSKQSVLVPQVYVRVRPGDLDGSGALLAGADVNLNLTGDLSNSGTIAGRNALKVSADNIRNMGGQMSADNLALQAKQDINNVGGTLQAQSAALLTAGRDINLTTTTSSSSVIASEARQSSNSFAQTGIDRVAGLYVSGSAGVLLASAGRDLQLTAAAVGNAGTGPTVLAAGNNLNLSTVTTSSSQNIVWDANNRLSQSQSQDVGSQISAAGNLTLSAGQDVNAKAASVNAGQALSVNAGNNINITAGQATQSLDEAHQHTNNGFLSSSTTTTRNQLQSTTAVASTFEGNSVNVNAGQDLSVKGSNVLADQNVNLAAGGNVNITAAQNTQSQSSFRQETKSGLMSSGGIGFTVGSRMQSVDGQDTSTTAAGSTVGSTGGNVTINAGGAYTQTGSDVLTPKGDIAITAKKVDITEARETGSQSTEQKFKQSGVTVAVTSGLVSNLQMADSQIKAAGNTSSDRMKALGTVNAAAGVVQAAQNATQLNVSITAGTSSSQSQQQSSADTAKGSNLNAGGNVTITATGAGKDSDITVRGSTIEAGKATSLKADDQVSLLAAANTTQESNSSKNSSASAGMTLGTGGLGFIASASAGKGNGSGNSTTYTNTQVSGNTVNIDSAGDTTLKGAVVSANQVTANVGGNLNIESLQDTSQYKEKSSQAGGSLFVGAGASGPVSGNVNVGQTKINSDYQSVGEQSAIRAGDGGFNVNVQGKTELIGGQITSTQAAIDNNKNSYEAKQGTSTTDLSNSANYKASSVSVGVGVGSVPGQSASAGMSGVGFGSDKGSAQSTTTAGISGVAGNTTARTGDKSTSIAPIFDKDKVQKEVSAQVAITGEFGKQASKAVGDYAQTKLKEAEKNNDQAGIDAWKEGGSSRVALHTLVGGLTGGVQGAVGAGTSQAVIDQVGQALKETNLPTELKQALVLAAGTAVGTAASGGSVAGGATAFNATDNNYLYHYNGKIVARDKKDNDKIINLSENDLRKLAAENPEVLNQLIAGIGKTDAPILVKDSSSQNMTGSSIQDLNNPNDRTAIGKEADMGYVNINGQARVFVQTGMDNTRQDAGMSAQALSNTLGGVNAGYINNGTEGLQSDVGEYLPNSLSKKDVLNEYTYRTLNTQGPTLIVTHSAGNEDARKALQAGAMYGHTYDNLSFVSMGSPVSNSAMRQTVTGSGANYLGQVNDWRDPVTNPKLWVAGTAAALVGGAAAGVALAPATGGGSLYTYFTALVGGGVGGGVGVYGLQKYHPLQNYIAKPQSQSIMFDWLKNNPQGK